MKMFLMIVLCIVIADCEDTSPEDLEIRREFQKFKTKNNYTYETPAEEEQGFLSFKKSYQFVDECNNAFAEGNSTFSCSVNKLAAEPDLNYMYRLNDFLEEPDWSRSDEELPEVPECPYEFLNYSAMGYPSTIVNQGRCGACWAFAATGACEAAYFKKHQELIKFSEQQLVDCTQSDEFNNFGCKGGRITAAMQYLQQYGAIQNQSYPKYTQYDNSTCSYTADSITTKIKSYKRLLKVEENYLKNLLCHHGPVTVAIDGTSRTFQFYSSGIYNDPSCRNYLNHAMLLVGFGTDPDFGQYWILKNSYGKKWGERGYMRLARGFGNLCGILEQVFICDF